MLSENKLKAKQAFKTHRNKDTQRGIQHLLHKEGSHKFWAFLMSHGLGSSSLLRMLFIQ